MERDTWNGVIKLSSQIYEWLGTAECGALRQYVDVADYEGIRLRVIRDYRGTSLIRNAHPPRTAVEP